MDGKIVACHQPNFLPWAGYFSKLVKADVFILLDDVQFTQGNNKHNWTSRVKILTHSGPAWLSLPVIRSKQGKQNINEVKIDPSDKRWLKKSLKTLEYSYNNATYFKELYPELEYIMRREFTHLCQLNIRLIEWLVEKLSIPTQILRSSRFEITSFSNDRLINLVNAVGGTVYLSGDGADEYQARDKYLSAGIDLRKANFSQRPYFQAQSTEFVAGMSIVDALFNIGAEATRSLLIEKK